ncbi:hypothetical protein [Rossellomorea aquimaris]|nr:hypothetical protein [Rossellomorea aquimaris]
MIEIAILIIVFASTGIIERTLKSMKDQNEQIIKLLEEIKDKQK